MSIRRIAAVIATFALAGLGPTPSFGDLSLSVTEYNSPTFSDGSHFSLTGITTSISLTPGVSETVVLDRSSSGLPGNGMTISGDAGGTMTLDGVSMSFSDNYSFPSSQTFSFSGGPPIVFNLATVEVTVTPIASSFDPEGGRAATFLETPLVAVPEPSSALTVGFAALVALGVWARRAMRRPSTGQ